VHGDLGWTLEGTREGFATLFRGGKGRIRTSRKDILHASGGLINRQNQQDFGVGYITEKLMTGKGGKRKHIKRSRLG